MLWRSKEAAHVTLLASIHVLDGPLPGWALDACDSADIIVFEADLTTIPDLPEMPTGRTLFGLSPRLGRAATTEAARLGLDLTMVDRLYPYATAMKFFARVTPSDIRHEYGVEPILCERASQAKYLETADEYFRLVFFEPPLSEQTSVLQQTLKELTTVPRLLREAVTAWRRCDLEAVWRALKFQQFAAHFSRTWEGMFAKRHTLWTPRAVQFIEEATRDGQNLLIVVGCGHFMGPESFPAALARYNYHFEQC